MNYSPAFNNFGTVASAPDYVRAEFIRKVYNLLFSAILVTVVSGYMFVQPGLLQAALAMRGLLCILTFVTIFAMMFTRKMSGANLFCYYAFAVLQGALIGPLLYFVDKYAPGIPLQAGIVTIGVFGGLSAYAFQTRKDFSYMGGFLFAALIGLVISGIVMMFFHNSLMATIYSFFGVMIFSGYVLYDTSQIIHKLTPSEAVDGAISLYLDFLNLFLFILQLLMQFSGNGRSND